MFDIPNNFDITEQLLVDQLKEKIINSDDCWWDKRDAGTCFEYKYVSEIKETIHMIFRIYRYKTHNEHIMSVYMSRKNNTVYVPMFIVDGEPLMDLIKCIENNNKCKDILE